jgi:hypothetical protein
MLRSRSPLWACLAAVLGTTACTGIPPLILNGDRTADAPAGPKVASLVANLKCELWDAVHSTTELPYYKNDPAALATPPAIPRRNKPDVPPDRAFTLKNIFEEIEYVGQAQWTLDVTGAGSINPNLLFPEYIDKAIGVFPATGVVLSVNGQLSDTAHRNVQLFASIDFSRLIESPIFKGARNQEPITSVGERPQGTCNTGSELGGNLGLKETLASGLIAAAMNDLTVFPEHHNASGDARKSEYDKSPVTSVPTNYSFGQISAVIEFTIVENINAGPTWTLRYFKGPGGSSLGFLNFNRQIKDTLTVTFLPVCIRQKYVTWSEGPPFEYHPRMVEGTPAWANYLPPCDSGSHMQHKVEALAKAKSDNDQILIQNFLQTR